MRFILLSLVVCFNLFASDYPRGLSENSSAPNSALLVSVAKGLPGLNFDIENVTKMVTHASNGYTVKSLTKGQGTTTNIASALTEISKSVDSRGSVFFYFTGHGNKGIVLAEDRSMKIAEIRKAIEEGRKEWGPLQRLVLFFDSCYSGSLLDPVRASQNLANEIYETFASNRASNYWQRLFVFASASANETCEATGQGSAFTLGLNGAFEKAKSGGWTVNQFIEETKRGTSGSHPVARLDPPSIGEESIFDVRQ